MADRKRSTAQKNVRPGAYRGATFEVGERCVAYAPGTHTHGQRGSIVSTYTRLWVNYSKHISRFVWGYKVLLDSGEMVFLLPGEASEISGAARHLKLVPKRPKIFDEDDHLVRWRESRTDAGLS